jgi:alpha-N-arabinofuranosidase
MLDILLRRLRKSPFSGATFKLTQLTLAFGTFAIAATANAAPGDIKVALDVAKPGPVIDRHIFGQFAEHLGQGIYGGIWVGKDSPIPNTRGIRNDVVMVLKDLKVPDVRWPGGCFADEYNWRRGIGPARKPSINTNWGGVLEPNSFGTDEFMDFISQIGAEAYVSVNVGSSTPKDAAEWVEYMTSSTDDAMGKQRADNGHNAPYKVAYVGLGNESWDCGGGMTPDFYVNEMKRFARFVHSYNTEQPMKRIAVGPNGADTGYTEAVMKAWKGHTWAWDIEGLSLHSYTTGGSWPPNFKATGFGEDEYASLLNETMGMDTLIRTHSAIMDTYDPEKKVALVVDEWGAWLAPTPGSHPGFLEQQNSQRDALIAALNLNIFARHADRVRMANVAQMVNVLQAMILTNNDKMLLTPTYHVFHMYVPFQDATSLPLTYNPGVYSSNGLTLPRVDAIAAKSKDGRVWIAISNIDPIRPASFDFSITGLTVHKASGQTLSAPKIDSVNTFDAPTTVSPKPISAKIKRDRISLIVAPASVTVICVD